MTPGPATVLVVDDEHLIRWSLEQQLRRDGYTVLLAETGAEALSKAQAESPDLILLDVRLPDADGLEILERLRASDPESLVIMITAHGGVQSAVRAMKLGAYDYVIKPFDMEELKLTVRKALETRALRRDVARFQAELRHGSGLGDIVGLSRVIRDLKALVQRIAQSDATTVLLEGESGTGKDLVARVIHFESARAKNPFLAVNCVALPEHLLESELFGHEKGSFTDAKALKKGLFEQADGGTVYLDEIGDMKPDLQAKLLRLIEEKTFRRVGGMRDLRVDVRIIAATNRDLAKALEAGEFRKDLYYRLKVFPIFLAPLREHPEDILPLTKHFLARFNREMRREILDLHPEAQACLTRYVWPGNVRELRNVLERAMILTSGEMLHLEHLPPEIGAGPAERPPAPQTPPKAVPAPFPTEGVRLEEVERDLVRMALDATEGNQVRAARLLGISRDALRNRMKKFGFLSSS
ncbi:MAG: sigma-54-dependent Fis family transcriptional regulator [candidate division NC10 bacterium]|nr:sigma-54-dependent Fis family transcriptional regulator [candidate division NC10 bacterium]MBI2163584.1 sigma-54-dependent Fis family transcriptional regulator [candidate division NC10 bacterium]